MYRQNLVRQWIVGSYTDGRGLYLWHVIHTTARYAYWGHLYRTPDDVQREIQDPYHHLVYDTLIY